MMGTFRAWLMEQKKRKDPIGDLARDVIRDSKFKGTTVQELEDRMFQLHACAEALDALRDAKSEFLKDCGVKIVH